MKKAITTSQEVELFPYSLSALVTMETWH